MRVCLCLAGTACIYLTCLKVLTPNPFNLLPLPRPPSCPHIPQQLFMDVSTRGQYQLAYALIFSSRAQVNHWAASALHRNQMFWPAQRVPHCWLTSPQPPYFGACVWVFCAVVSFQKFWYSIGPKLHLYWWLSSQPIYLISLLWEFCSCRRILCN